MNGSIFTKDGWIDLREEFREREFGDDGVIVHIGTRAFTEDGRDVSRQSYDHRNRVEGAERNDLRAVADPESENEISVVSLTGGRLHRTFISERELREGESGWKFPTHTQTVPGDYGDAATVEQAVRQTGYELITDEDDA